MIGRMPVIFSPVFKLSVFALLLLVSLVVQANSLCFAKAKTYYEQLYCESKSRGYGGSLPGFYDFQRNNEMTQALLLKAPARQLGIELAMPVASPPPTVTAPPVQQARVATYSHCQFNQLNIACGSRVFQYQANQHNSALAEGVLDDANSIELPKFKGDYGDGVEAATYLVNAYEQYLDKMLAIGLAEATMAYGSFSYLFHDLRAKQVHFGNRFEKMYFYLKRDKQKMAVSSHPRPPASLTLEDCFALQRFWICERDRKNYLYRLIN